MASDDLIAFLNARLDEDEELARVAGALQADPENGWGTEGTRAVTPHIGVIHEDEARQHIVRHNPARVLAEVDAKRRILNRLEPFAAFDMPGVKAQAASREEWYVVVAARDAIKLLALPYAGHPDYQEFYWQI